MMMPHKEKGGDEMPVQVYHDAYRTTMICIDSYDQQILKGRMYNAYWENGIEFVGVMDLLRKMEKMLEQINTPQAFSAKRSFSPNMVERPTLYTDQNKRSGQIATFMIRLLFRQNASWQGSVTWCEGRMEESFRSVLELLLLMDSALDTK